MKKIDSMIKYKIPDRFCAPEQARIFLGKTDITSKNYQTKTDIGYALYTDMQKAEKLIKQFIRTKTNISKKIEKKKLAIRTSNNGYISLQYGGVNQYDIEEKLFEYKALKKAYTENRQYMQFDTCILDGNYKATKKETKTYRSELLKKITFI